MIKENKVVSLEEANDFNYLSEISEAFLFLRVTAALIASLFLKMKCHTLGCSAVINEAAAQIHRE